MYERGQIFDPRQVMHNETFEVFHYNQPRPQGVEVHHHDFYEVYYLLSGEVEYWVDGRVLKLEPGDLLFINPMELHRPLVQPDSPVYERIVLWINREYLKRITSQAGDLSRCFGLDLPNRIRPRPRERTALAEAFGELVRESYGSSYGSDVYAMGLFLQIMVQLNRLVLGASNAQEERSPLVEKTVRYISENLSGRLSLEEIAQACFVSKYHLSHTFCRETGISVYRYVMLRRLLRARQLLLTGEPAGQVCAACGFPDYTSFFRAFKKEYGISPREFAVESEKP